MRTAAARVIVGAAAAAGVAGVGNLVRGPYAEQSLPRDLAAGAALLTAALVVQWAMRETGGPRP